MTLMTSVRELQPPIPDSTPGAQCAFIQLDLRLQNQIQEQFSKREDPSEAMVPKYAKRGQSHHPMQHEMMILPICVPLFLLRFTPTAAHS